MFKCFEFQMFISDCDCFSSWSFPGSWPCQPRKYRATHNYSLLPQELLALALASEKCVSGSEAAFLSLIFRRKFLFNFSMIMKKLFPCLMYQGKKTVTIHGNRKVCPEMSINTENNDVERNKY